MPRTHGIAHPGDRGSLFTVSRRYQRLPAKSDISLLPEFRAISALDIDEGTAIVIVDDLGRILTGS